MENKHTGMDASGQIGSRLGKAETAGERRRGGRVRVGRDAKDGSGQGCGRHVCLPSSQSPLLLGRTSAPFYLALSSTG